MVRRGERPLRRHLGAVTKSSGGRGCLNVLEFLKNTQAIRVIKGVCNSQKRGNCRGGTEESCINDTLSACEPLPKRRHHSNQSKGTNCECNVFSHYLQYHITVYNFLGDDHEIVHCYVEPRCTGNELEQEEITGAYIT